LGGDVFVVMASLPGGGLGFAEHGTDLLIRDRNLTGLFSLEGVDEHAAAAVRAV
jgi:hypothetical protein